MSSSMIAGYHDLTYVDRTTGSSGTTIGATGPEGIRLNLTKNFQEIMTGEGGPETVMHTIAQGGNCFIEFVLQELTLNDTTRRFLAPARATASPTTAPAYNEVGRVGQGSVDPDAGGASVGIAGQLFAIPKVNTPADLAHQGTDANVRKFFGHVVGDLFETLDVSQNAIPVRFICLPFLVGTDLVWWDWVSA